MTADEPVFDAGAMLDQIRGHVRVIQDEATMPSLRATHGEWLAERVEQLDTWLTQRVHDVALPRDWDRRASRVVHGPRRVRRDDATHPRELPEPESVHATIAKLETAISAGKLVRRKLAGEC